MTEATVFVVHHSQGEYGENAKILGVFADIDSANEALKHYQELPGFRDHLRGFDISKYDIGRLYWEEGFGID